MQEIVTEIVARRRDRAIASLLGVKEREVDQYLPPEVKARLRKAILDQLNDFTTLVLDVVRSLNSDSSVVLNELYLQKLDEIHQSVMARVGD
jgi:hypothetical protein